MGSTIPQARECPTLPKSGEMGGGIKLSASKQTPVHLFSVLGCGSDATICPDAPDAVTSLHQRAMTWNYELK